jgi:hypothetical protein
VSGGPVRGGKSRDVENESATTKEMLSFIVGKAVKGAR